MPRQAIAYLVVIILSAIGCLLLTANLLNVQKSWNNSLTKLRESNEKNAATLAVEGPKLNELKSELTRKNLGWENTWTDVPTSPNRETGVLTINIGSNNGIVAAQDAGGQAIPMTLHAFQPQGDGFIYVGPFLARPEDIKADQTQLVMGWNVYRSSDGVPETQSWGQGNWRFRSEIPAQDKIRFESMTNRFGTNLSTFFQTQASIKRQDALLIEAKDQLQQREQELNGAPDVPEEDIDPLRPELKIGLIEATDEEEEGRNALELEVDALRRQVLDQKAVQQQLMDSLKNSGAISANPRPPRIGSRPK